MSVQEGLDKVRSLRGSKIPSHQRQVSLLEGVEQILKEERQETNATAYFATLLTLLDRAEVAESATELLALVVPHVSKALLASKIDFVVAKLLPNLLSTDDKEGTSAVRSSIAVLESILISIDSSAWNVSLSEFGAPRTFSGLLALAKDSRPKIRKRAVEAVSTVLEEGKGGKKLALDAAVASVESSDSQKLVHALQLLKVVVGSSADQLNSKQIEELVVLLMKVVRKNDQYAVLAAFAVFGKIPLSDSKAIEGLLELSPSISDKQMAPAWLAVIAQSAPPILSVIGAVTPFLTSTHPEVVESSGQCLIALISESLDPEDLNTVREVSSDYLFPLLQVKYHSAWATVCEVCAAFIAVLPYELAPKVEGVLNIVRVVGALRTSANEADQVLGAAIRVLGAEEVLKLVPLQLDPVSGNGRAWMLPLLAQHVGHTQVGYYFREIVPLALEFEAAAAELSESRRTKILVTIAEQLYTLFPKFCDECTDAMTAQQLQEILGWLYTKVQMRPSLCLGLKFLAQNENGLPFVAEFGSDILKALFNVFQSMAVETRGYVLECCDSYLQKLPQPEVVQLFNQVSTLLAQSLQDNDLRHTMMDITNAILPYLTDESSEISTIFLNLFKTVGNMKDPLMQKKAYRSLTLFGAKIDNNILSQLLLEMQDSVQPNATRTRLQSLLRVIENLDNNGDFSFVFKILPEIILGVKDSNEKTRKDAFNILVLTGQKMLAAGENGGYVDHSNISEIRDNNSKQPVDINSYFEMIVAGLAGSSAHMVAATVTSLARVLFEFHEVLVFDKLQEYIELVWMLLESPNREIVGAVLGFVKVSVLIISPELLTAKLPSLLNLILAWSNEHKNHFKNKVRHLIERLMRRCGYEEVERAFPEKDMKLLHNIHKSKERARRKRGQPAAQAPEEHKRQYENEFDQALYGSDSESEAEMDVEEPQNDKRKSKQFIIGGDDDPLDLLDERALSRISSTKPQPRKTPKKHQLPQTKDGRMVIGRDVEAERDLATKNALSAYMDAVKSGPVRTQQGKLKYLRGKRAQKENDDDDDEPALKPNVKNSRVDKSRTKKHMQKRRRL